MEIAKVKEHIGAIVTGIDLAHPIDDATQKKLYDAVVENEVLVIRGQEHLIPTGEKKDSWEAIPKTSHP
jgi:alpha-ketoglutarate-dependent taurine dioxygenase